MNITLSRLGLFPGRRAVRRLSFDNDIPNVDIPTCDPQARPLCMITSDEQISPPSLVCKENSLPLHSLYVGILFKFTALGHSFMQNFATLQFKTRLGGEICSFDVNMHKPAQYGLEDNQKDLF